MLHAGTADQPVRCRPLGAHHARLTLRVGLPWHVGDRALLRDPGSRRIWAVRVVDVDPLPLRRRGAARRRAEALEGAVDLADVRLRSRAAEHPSVLARTGLGQPGTGARAGDWWVDEEALARWAARAAEVVRAHHEQHPLSEGPTVAEVAHLLELPPHLLELPPHAPAAAGPLVRAVVQAAGLVLVDGRVRPRSAGGLGPAEPAVAELEARLRESPFVAPERDDLAELGLGQRELAAAARLGRLVRLADDIVLLPDAPARAMRELAALEQPFTLSAARQALGTTRRVAVPLLEHLDGRGWTRRVDGQLREVVR